MICVSIVPGTNGEALSLLGRALPLADLVELRVDRIDSPDLPLLLCAGKDRILVTNRRRDEGGFFAGNEAGRLAMLHEAVKLGVYGVDIEARTGLSAVSGLAGTIRAEGRKTKLIVSSHDLAGTPSRQVLARRVNACWMPGADIAKIVTLAKTPEDNLRVLELIPQARKTNQNVIAFCMGERGVLSRVAAPLLGSPIAYASLERGAESAPGQLTADEMKAILGMLKK